MKAEGVGDAACGSNGVQLFQSKEVCVRLGTAAKGLRKPGRISA